MATAKRRAHSKRTQAAAPEKVQQPTSIDTPPAHTPGPWTYEKNGGAFIVTHDSGGMPTIVADVCNYASRGEANARLIAAAPDLLSQLIQVAQCLRMSLLNVSDRETRELGIEIVMDAHRAIAKAGGA